MSRDKIYVGRKYLNGQREIFRLPSSQYKQFGPYRGLYPSHIYIKYTFVIGPFKTVSAAKLCVEDNDCSSLSVAKTYEKRYLIRKSQTELIESYKQSLTK